LLSKFGIDAKKSGLEQAPFHAITIVLSHRMDRQMDSKPLEHLLQHCFNSSTTAGPKNFTSSQSIRSSPQLLLMALQSGAIPACI